jgi:hypothetical protein
MSSSSAREAPKEEKLVSWKNTGGLWELEEDEKLGWAGRAKEARWLALSESPMRTFDSKSVANLESENPSEEEGGPLAVGAISTRFLAGGAEAGVNAPSLR